MVKFGIYSIKFTPENFIVVNGVTDAPYGATLGHNLAILDVANTS